MDVLQVPPDDAPYIQALRETIRTGVMASPTLEQSPLIDLPIVLKESGADASPSKRAHVFIEVLRRIIQQRLEYKEAETAMILFGLEKYAGIPIQTRYQTVAKLFNPHWTWENYRKEPLTRHLYVICLALKREVQLESAPSAPIITPQGKVLIVQNISHEGPGLIARMLKETAVPYEVVDLSKGETFPDPTGYSALIVMGGPDSANDTSDKIQAELRRVKRALDANIPYLGICLGLQVAVKASGGKVVKGVKEVGLRNPEGVPYHVSLTDIALTASGKKDPLFLGLRNDFRVFQLHGETVEIIDDMQLLAEGQECRNQIVKIQPKAYGIQSHFELTMDMLHDWLDIDEDLSKLDKQHVLDEFATIEEVYTLVGLSLFRNFLHVAGVLNYE
jgi:GMP synthase (glutamine-hydrolysing)